MSSESAERRARRKTLVAYLNVAVVLGPVYAAFFAYFDAPYSAIAPALFFVASLAALALAKRELCETAAWTLVGGLWAGPVWASFTTGGLHSPLLIWLTPAPFMAGALLGRRAALVLGSGSVVAVAAMRVVQGARWLPVEMQDGLGASLLALMSGMAAVALLTFYGYATTKNFEQAQHELVAAHTAAVAAAEEALQRNRDLRAVLDNVDQGMVRVAMDGRVLPGYSAVLERWFGAPPDGVTLWSYASAHAPSVAAALELAWEDLADDVMPYEVVLDQLPKRIELGGRHFGLALRPVGEPMQSVMVMVTDVTQEVLDAKARAANEDLMALFMMAMKAPHAASNGTRELDGLLERARQSDGALRKRELHTYKGAAGVLGLKNLARCAHELEDRLEAQGTLERADWSDLASAHALLKARASEFLERSATETAIRNDVLAATIEALRAGDVHSALNTLELASGRRVRECFASYAQAAKDVAVALGKPAPRVTMVGGELPVPDGADRLFAALVHVVRNAVDHGIEAAAVREAAGKHEQGNVELRAEAQDGRFVVSITDDGAGVDWERLRAKARACGLPHTSSEDLVAAMFADGLSSRDEVNEYSGRGVGMSAVLGSVQQLGGDVAVDSGYGRGCTVRVTLPRSEAGSAPIAA